MHHIFEDQIHVQLTDRFQLRFREFLCEIWRITA